MGQSAAKQNSKVRLLDKLFDSISESQKETINIMADVDQMTDLMSSLMEAQTGKIVSFDMAFGDL